MENLDDTYVTITTEQPYIIPIIVAVVIVLITLIIFTCRKSSSGQCVHIAGICEAGKTVLFKRVTDGIFVDTYTSMKENSATYKIPNSKKNALSLVDIPGSERLRHECLDRYTGKTRAIIYVVDSVAIQKEIKDVSQYLFSILTNKALCQGHPPVLVACNKSDVALAKGTTVIRAMLEKELNLLRVTQSATLESTSGDASSQNTVFLGKQGQDFAFSQLRSKVEFCECSARGNKDGEGHDLKAVVDWLAKVA